MNTTQLIRAPQAPSADNPPPFGELLEELLPWIAVFVVGGPLVLLGLMLWAPVLLLVALVAAPVAGAILVALAGGILATPYLLVRHLHRRFAERRHSRKSPVPIPVSAFAERTTVGGSR